MAGVAPRVMDLLAPAGFKPTQEQQLSSYNATTGSLATVRMVTLINGTGAEMPTTSTTSSSTATTTSSPTPSQTTTSSTSPSPTPSPTSSPSTSSATSTTPTSTSTSSGRSICGPAALLVLALIPLLLRWRRR
ncbi:glucodextranase DOMON-like domain-containing protein [Thermococcus sp.]|uniref:glucodextranase DOMON-like domain-containing protein n=1 Tax=Thermococcus sp. TaxID=35749 RepID=UPI0025FA1A44|nr:glucodextranase DOMON-like domain-containing protein [Thermococcus sp.]